jgi:serine/threonine protein kinase
MADLTGQYLGRYYLTERLGEGGMATVYKGYDTRLERDVAVKLIRRSAFSDEVLENVLKRFEREAKSLAKLSHPNIVKVYDYGEHEGSPYLVMEYLPGGTLKNRLGDPLSWQDAVRLLLPVARGVAYAHQHGILHRDIKPANILITESGEPMLSDFGIAKLFETDQTTSLTSGLAIGTPEYMAPEQWNGMTSPQSDLYSLGMVLYEMVAGRKPYVADTPAAIMLKQATEPLPSPRAFGADFPEAVDLVVVKALARNPQDRYQDVDALVGALERVLVDLPGIRARYQAVRSADETQVSPWMAGTTLHAGNTVQSSASRKPDNIDTASSEPHESRTIISLRSPIPFLRLRNVPDAPVLAFTGILLIFLIVILVKGSLFGQRNLGTPILTPVIFPTDPPPISLSPTFVIPSPTDIMAPTITLAPTSMSSRTPTVETAEVKLGNWIIIVASAAYSYESALKHGQKYVDAGYTVQVMETSNNNIRVVVVGFKTEEEANNALLEIQKLNSKAYVRKLSEWCSTRVSYPDHILCK